MLENTTRNYKVLLYHVQSDKVLFYSYYEVVENTPRNYKVLLNQLQST